MRNVITIQQTSRNVRAFCSVFKLNMQLIHQLPYYRKNTPDGILPVRIYNRHIQWPHKCQAGCGQEVVEFFLCLFSFCWPVVDMQSSFLHLGGCSALPQAKHLRSRSREDTTFGGASVGGTSIKDREMHPVLPLVLEQPLIDPLYRSYCCCGVLSLNL